MGSSSGGSNLSTARMVADPSGAIATQGLQRAGVDIPGTVDKITGQVNNNGGLLGRAGDDPRMANIQQGTSVQDVGRAQHDTQYSLESQRALMRALQAQNGIGAQSNLSSQLQAANGVGTQNQAISGLQGASNMYQNIAQGNGPNPAQAMLNQATGQNVANQAALMAGQRGASANVGLMARQAAQQGAAAQQQAVGQGATMQANQQINALSGLTGAQQAMGNLGGAQAQMQQAQANQMANQQIGATNQTAQNDLANQQSMQNALQGVNNSNVASQASVNTGNVGLSQANTAGKQAIFGGMMQGAGAAMGAARGGVVHMNEGGMTPAPPVGAQSSFGQFMNGASASNNMAASSDMATEMSSAKQPEFSGSKLEKGTAGMAAGIGKKAMAASRGGLAHGGGNVKASSPAQKPVKEGNSYSNDKIPAMLSEGEIVLPRSVTQGQDPVKAAASFVSQVLAKRKVKK